MPVQKPEEKFEILFKAEKFFEAHEFLEEFWMQSAGTEKKLYQGLIQIAVALHHLKYGNLNGAQTCYKRAKQKLTQLPKKKQIYAQKFLKFYEENLK